jgi:hypothetical protein
MWQLSMMIKTETAWSVVGHFETLTEVAKRIIELDRASPGRNALFYVKQQRQ